MSRISNKPLKQYPWYLRIFFYFQRKKYGSILEPTLVWGRQPKLFLIFLKFFRTLERKSSSLSPKLRSAVMVYVSQINECPFCIDMNGYALIERTKNPNILDELLQLEKSKAFSDEEKCALEYASAMTKTGENISDELFARLQSYFSDDAIVELTALTGFQNLSSKFNSALQISAYGFCKKR